jgi:hypothetical protein
MEADNVLLEDHISEIVVLLSRLGLTPGVTESLYVTVTEPLVGVWLGESPDSVSVSVEDSVSVRDLA